MDARTGATSDSHAPDMEALQVKRVRLLASLTLMAGVGLLISLPFALRAGAEFFLPVTAALVVAIALVPMLEWFERRGVPSKLASRLCVLVFLAIAIFALAAIVYPGDRLGRADPAADRPGDRGARAAARPLFQPREVHRPDRGSDLDRGQPGAHGSGRNAQFDARDHHRLGAARRDPAVLRAAGDLFLPRRLDRDAQAHDRQPRQLRRRADHRPGDPADGRRDLDLYRHDHRHQCLPRRASPRRSCGRWAWIRR